jgi:hypothetical protein
MRDKKWPALIVFSIGLLYILIPRHVFPICEFAEAKAAAMAGSEAAAMAGHGGHGNAQGQAQPAVAPDGHDEGGHMVCWYTWRAEIAIGIAVAIVGLLLAFSGLSARSGLYSASAAVAVAGLLIPTAIVGVCPGASMPCRVGTLPALALLAVAHLAFSVACAWLSKGPGR